MKKPKSLESRMKEYEAAPNAKLPENMPVILRVDGRAFHTFTRGLVKPFDATFIGMMNKVGLALCNEIMCARLAYLQSDEVSVLIYNGLEQGTWFGNNIQKMTSVSASIASAIIMKEKAKVGFKPKNLISFDSRVFIVPRHDIVNYFLWRQRDWERNSLQMVARSYYSQKQLQGRNQADLHELIYQKGDNWDKYQTRLKRGRCIIKQEVWKDCKENLIPNEGIDLGDGRRIKATGKAQVLRGEWQVDNEIPIFSQDRDYILNRIPEW